VGVFCDIIIGDFMNAIEKLIVGMLGVIVVFIITTVYLVFKVYGGV
jgi:hypothetical protein